jgi:hypothetical protein
MIVIFRVQRYSIFRDYARKSPYLFTLVCQSGKVSTPMLGDWNGSFHLHVSVFKQRLTGLQKNREKKSGTPNEVPLLNNLLND